MANASSNTAWANPTEFLAAQSRFDDALSVAAAALADTDELLHLRSRALRLHANLLAQNGADTSAVEAAYRAEIECAPLGGARYFELQATTSFARWLDSRHRPAEARTLLSEIYGWFAEGFDTFALREAQKLLDQLDKE